MTLPESIDETSAARRATLAAARAVAICSCVFSLVVAALIVINHYRIKAADPVNSKALTALIAEVEKRPADDALKGHIRTLDLLARKAFYTSQRFAIVGAYLLAGGIVVMLVSLHVVRVLTRRPPDVAALADRSLERDPAALSRSLVMAVGAALVAVTLVIVLGEGPAPSMPIGATPPLPPSPSPTPASPPAGSPEITPAGGDWFPTQRQVLANWPSFRGPNGLGVATVESAPVDWDGPSGRNLLWKTPVPKPGFNSPVVWGGRVFVSGADEGSREVYCLDADTGALLWTHQASTPGSPAGELPEVAVDTGLAAATVATDGRRVFAIFATGELVAVDYQGRRVWSNDFGVPDNPYGHASSLILFENVLLVQYDHAGGGNLYAFEAATGRPLWHRKRAVDASWASPVISDMGEGPKVLLNAAPLVEAYDPLTGELWMSVDCMVGEVAPSPASTEGLVFATNQYAVLAAIDPIAEEVVWKTTDNLPDVSSPLAADGLLWLASAYGVACLEAKSGRVLWQEEFGDAFYASPVLAAGNVYLLDRAGTMHIFKAAPKYEPVAKAVLGEESVCTPAFSEGRIYLRGETHLFCFEKP